MICSPRAVILFTQTPSLAFPEGSRCQHDQGLRGINYNTSSHCADITAYITLDNIPSKEAELATNIHNSEKKTKTERTQTRFKVHVQLKASLLYGANDVVVKVVWWEISRADGHDYLRLRPLLETINGSVALLLALPLALLLALLAPRLASASTS